MGVLDFVKNVLPKKKEVSKATLDKHHQQIDVQDSTFIDLKNSVDNSLKDDPKDRITRIFGGREKRLMNSFSTQRDVQKNSDREFKRSDVNLKEAADYIAESGKVYVDRKNGKILVNIDAYKWPKTRIESAKICLLDVLPPMKEFAVKIRRHNKDGSPGEEVYNQVIRTRINKDGGVEYFYKKQGREVVLDKSLLNVGHISIETSLNFDENFSKKAVKEKVKEKFEFKTKEKLVEMADKTAKLLMTESQKFPQYRIKLPNRKKEYVSYDENKYVPKKMVDLMAKISHANENVQDPVKLEESIETNENFVKGVDSFGNSVIVRKTVYEAFKIAKKIAHEMGYKLKVFSSYRSYEDQSSIVAKQGWKYGSKEARKKWIADPGNSPHHTGGALDLRAVDSSGRMDQVALKTIMEKAGFVNYPVENWHWEYGTSRWAREKGEDIKYAKIMNLKDQKVGTA